MAYTAVSGSRRSFLLISVLILVCLFFFFMLASVSDPSGSLVGGGGSSSFSLPGDSSVSRRTASTLSSGYADDDGDDDEDDDTNEQEGGDNKKRNKKLLRRFPAALKDVAAEAQNNEVPPEQQQQGQGQGDQHNHNFQQAPAKQQQHESFFSLLSQLQKVVGPCNYNMSEEYIVETFLDPELRPLRNLSAPVATTTAAPTTTTAATEAEEPAPPPPPAERIDGVPLQLGLRPSDEELAKNAKKFKLIEQQSLQMPKAAKKHMHSLQLLENRKKQQEQQQQQVDPYVKKRQKALREIRYDLKHNQHRCFVTRQWSHVPLYPRTIAEYRAPFLFGKSDEEATTATATAVTAAAAAAASEVIPHLAPLPTPYKLRFSSSDLIDFNFDGAFAFLTKIMAGATKEEATAAMEAAERERQLEEERHQEQHHAGNVSSTTVTTSDDDHGGAAGHNAHTDHKEEAATAAAAAAVVAQSEQQQLRRPLTPSIDENMRIFFAFSFYKAHGRVPNEQQFSIWLRNITTRVTYSGASASSSSSSSASSPLKFCNLDLRHSAEQQQQQRKRQQEQELEQHDNDRQQKLSPQEQREEQEARQQLQQQEDQERQQYQQNLQQEHHELQERLAKNQSPPPVSRRWSLRPRHSFTVMVNKTRIWEHLIPDVRLAFPTELQRCHAVGARMLAILVSIFEKHNLRIFFISHGSLLGAVRNGGALPWDVDIDVAMPESHMKTLRKIWRSEFPREMFLQTETTEPGFQMYTARRSQIRIKDRFSCSYGVPSMITRGRNTRVKLRKTHHGFGIDIIPLEKRNRGLQYKLLHNFFNTNDIFPLSTISYNGVLVPAPRNVKRFLSNLYGPDFMTNVKHPPAHFGGTESFPCLATYACPGTAWSLNWTSERSQLRLFPQEEEAGHKIRAWQQQIQEERAKHFEDCRLAPRDDANSNI